MFGQIFEGERSYDSNRQVFGRGIWKDGTVDLGYFKGMSWELSGEGIRIHLDGSIERGHWDG